MTGTTLVHLVNAQSSWKELAFLYPPFTTRMLSLPSCPLFVPLPPPQQGTFSGASIFSLSPSPHPAPTLSLVGALTLMTQASPLFPCFFLLTVEVIPSIIGSYLPYTCLLYTSDAADESSSV